MKLFNWQTKTKKAANKRQNLKQKKTFRELFKIQEKIKVTSFYRQIRTTVNPGSVVTTYTMNCYSKGL